MKKTIIEKPKRKNTILILITLLVIAVIVSSVFGVKYFGKQKYQEGYQKGVRDVVSTVGNCNVLPIDLDGKRVTVLSYECLQELIKK